MIDPIRAASIRTLYEQMGTSALAGIVVTSYMVGTAWAFTSKIVILVWLAAQIALQVSRQFLLRAWRRRERKDEELERWARIYTFYMVISGSLWGSSFFLFAHLDQPLTVALTMCCLYGVTGGSVPLNAYNPPGLHALVGLTFAPLVGRLLATGNFEYILLGIASALFAATMFAVCRVQSATLREGYRIRFENDALVAALSRERAEADEARRQAELASLAKSQFLAAASHDLRQPLYALSLFSSSLGDLRLDDEGRGVVRRIQDSINVMESLFEGLLDLSKLEAGVIEARAEPVSVEALFDRIGQVFRPLALERGLDLRLRCDGEWVESDPILLEQVLGNLVSNAIRWTPRGGILLAVRPRGDGLRFEIWDTGVGIAAADLSRIFDEYVQLENPERDRRRGLGLGLSIARRAVALIGSRIEVMSRVGRGSFFSFSQPACAPPALTASRPTLDPAQLQAIPRRDDLPILVIEDDEDVRGALCNVLARWRVAHEAVANADAAMELIAAGREYGLIVTDQRLTGSMNGMALIRRLRAELRDPPPAVVISGEYDVALIQATEAEGVPLLLKPVRPAQLRSLLGLGRATDETAGQPSTDPPTAADQTATRSPA